MNPSRKTARKESAATAHQPRRRMQLYAALPRGRQSHARMLSYAALPSGRQSHARMQSYAALPRGGRSAVMGMATAEGLEASGEPRAMADGSRAMSVSELSFLIRQVSASSFANSRAEEAAAST